MTDSVFARIAMPVASKEDATRTCEAALPRLRRAEGEAHILHVIEKGGGTLDKASLEQAEQAAAEIFRAGKDVFTDAGFADFETHLLYGIDVPATIIEACDELDATAVVFVTRRASRWKRLLSGDVALNLITDNLYPVLILPDPQE